jgi:hypothetical protein
MALSFLYLAFVRVFQLLRLLRRSDEQLAIKASYFESRSPFLRRQVARLVAWSGRGSWHSKVFSYATPRR